MQPGVPNACQCRGRGFSPWSRKIPHAMRQLSPCTTTTEPAQMVKNPPTMQETWVQSLVWEDPLEKELAIHSSILAWIIPWTKELPYLTFNAGS